MKPKPKYRFDVAAAAKKRLAKMCEEPDDDEAVEEAPESNAPSLTIHIGMPHHKAPGGHPFGNRGKKKD